MLLILGNPGPGYTTLLSVLSNHRNGFAEITGGVSFGSMTSQEAKQYRGLIIMNTLLASSLYFIIVSVFSLTPIRMPRGDAIVESRRIWSLTRHTAPNYTRNNLIIQGLFENLIYPPNAGLSVMPIIA